METKASSPIFGTLIHNVFEELEVHVLFDFLSWAVRARQVARRSRLDEDVAREFFVNVRLRS